MHGFLYGQSEYNMLRNAMHLDDYINYAKQYNYTFLSITDSNLYACYKFYTACKKNSIKPIIGLEYTSLEGDVFLCYAMSNEGYKTLLHLTNSIKANGFSEDIAFLKENNKDIAVVLVATNSILSKRDYSEQKNILIEYKEAFENFYVGIALQETKEIDINLLIAKVCVEVNVLCLPLHKTLYLEDEDLEVYNALCDFSSDAKKINICDDFSFPKNLAEFDEHKYLFDNLNKLIDAINLTLFETKPPLPHFPNNKNVSSKDYLYGLCSKGLEKRLQMNNIANSDEYLSRLNYELTVIHNMGYDDYFLIVWEFIKYAKQSDVLVGPGRGSAAGSLVAYSLGITEVDPIKYNLLFERFLNPDRISMPDIDTDFPDDKRDMIISHVKDFYGRNHICNISAYGTFQIKSSIRELARVWKWDNELIGELVDIAVNKKYEEICEMFNDREDILKLFRIAKKLENLPKHISTHAAGIILSSASLNEIIPLQEGLNGLYQSQLEASDLEKIGLLKMDFLGIRNLTMINDMINEISNFSKRKLYDLSLANTQTYKLLQAGDTLGIFQLESQGIRQVLMKLKPVCFEDLVAVLALYRPGPMDNIDEFIQRSRGKKFTYVHESLKYILEPTYGIIVYQEQIMQIVQTCGKYTLAEADLLRRAVSKKDESTLKFERDKFVKRSVANGYLQQTANEIYDYIVKFANYGFNRSHSVAYAMVSYQMAYLKANHFPVFMSNILNNEISSKDSLREYIAYANSHNLKICKPNINVSTNRFINTPNGVFIPILVIYGIGEVVTRQIIEERRKGLFLSFDDFKLRCASFINNNHMEALIYSGALDLFSKTKKEMIEDKASYLSIMDRHLDGVIENNGEFDEQYLAEMEAKYLGFNIEYSPFRDLVKLRENAKYKSINEIIINDNATLYVKFANLKVLQTKNNQAMMVGSIIDGTAKIRMVIFPKEFEKYRELINEKVIYEIQGRVQLDNKNQEKQIVISTLKIAVKP